MTTTTRPWWADYGDMLPAAFTQLVAAEDRADRIWTYEPHLLPGLLQTPAYARHVMAAAVGVTPQGVERGMPLRATRQLVLRRDPAPAYHAVVDETAVRRAAALPDADEHLAGLLAAAAWPNITLQVLPLDAGPAAGGSHPFTVVGVPEGATVGYVETPTFCRIVDLQGEVDRLVDTFDALMLAALGPDASVELVGEIAAVLR